MGATTFSRSTVRIPREHGFWVMLGTALSCAIGTAPERGFATLAAIGVAAAAIGLGAWWSRSVRRSSNFQLASSVLLAASGLPVSLVGGAPLESAIVTALAFAVIFFSGALLVRGAFARARGRGRAVVLHQAVAAVLSSAATVAFALSGFTAAAISSALVVLLVTVVALVRPTTKHLKPVGLALAAVSTAALVILIVG